MITLAKWLIIISREKKVPLPLCVHVQLPQEGDKCYLPLHI